jgi:protein-S-isoprenylcysteine O-methyltransferase Ste14
MSAIPAFGIGAWNAWILTLAYFLVPPLLMALINRKALGKSGSDTLYGNLNRIYFFATITYFLTLIYSIFLPLKLGTPWFYTGLTIYLVGLIMYIIAWINFDMSPLDDPTFNGLYRYSRHPMYITQSLILIGMGIAVASWLFLLFSAAYIIFSFARALREERYCLEKYGDAYREYMDRTPRWIGIPKS